MKRLWLLLIVIYQRWISPWKGFRCAHAAYHGELTCSEAVKRIIGEHGLWGGRRLIRQRLTDCRHAAHELHQAPPAASGNPGPLREEDKPPVRPELTDDAKPSQLEQPGGPPPPASGSYFKRRGVGNFGGCDFQQTESCDCSDAACGVGDCLFDPIGMLICAAIFMIFFWAIFGDAIQRILTGLGF